MAKHTEAEDDVEDLLAEASIIADLAYAYVCHVGFEMAVPRRLTEREGELIYWLASRVSHQIDHAKEACRRDREGETMKTLVEIQDETVITHDLVQCVFMACQQLDHGFANPLGVTLNVALAKLDAIAEAVRTIRGSCNDAH